MRCAVGAPILVDDRMWGVMAAGWALPGKASSEAAERTAEFTELVATALANTESRNEITRLAEEQAALRRVATLVARGAPPPEVFEAVIARRSVSCFPGRMPQSSPATSRTARYARLWLEQNRRARPGRIALGSQGVRLDAVLRTGRSARVDRSRPEAVGGPTPMSCDSSVRSPVGSADPRGGSPVGSDDAGLDRNGPCLPTR